MSELGKIYPDLMIKLIVFILDILDGLQASIKGELETIPACRSFVGGLATITRWRFGMEKKLVIFLW